MVDIGLETMLKLMDKQFAGVTDPTGALRPFIDGSLFVDASFICAPTSPTLSSLFGKRDGCKDPLSFQDALDLFRRVKRTVLDDESVYSSPMQLSEISDLVFLDGISGSVDHACRANISSLKVLRDEVYKNMRRRVPSANVRTAGFTSFIDKVNGKVFAGEDRRPSKADIELVAYAFTQFYEKSVPVALVTLDKCQSVLAQDCARLLFNPESPMHIGALVTGRDPNNFVVFTGKYDSSASVDSDWIHFTSTQVDGKPLRMPEMYSWRMEKECNDLRAALESYRAKKTQYFVEYSITRMPPEGVNFKNTLNDHLSAKGVRAVLDNGAKLIRVSSTEFTIDALKSLVARQLQLFNEREQRKAELVLANTYEQDEEDKMPSERKLQLLERAVVYFKGQVESYTAKLENAQKEKEDALAAKEQLEHDLDEFLRGERASESPAVVVSHEECKSAIQSLEDEISRRPVYVPSSFSSESKDAFSYIRILDEELASDVFGGKKLSDFKELDADASKKYAAAKNVLELPEGNPFINRAEAQKFVDDYDVSVKHKAHYDQVIADRDKHVKIVESSVLELVVNMVDKHMLAPVDVSASVAPLEHKCLEAVELLLGAQIPAVEVMGVPYAAFNVPSDVSSFKGALVSELSRAGVPVGVKVRVLDLKEY
ncbi:hypothetical protein J4219_04290 [Candidatus Woesearchaeota archaeon]|nr:hypothetical protein [Candidatus Woesearchaeota archaeon]